MFKSRLMHFIHLNVNITLPKIEEIYHLAKLTNDSVIGISETKPNGSILSKTVAIEGYNPIRKDRSRKTGGVAGFNKHSRACSHIHLKMEFIFTVICKSKQST